MEALYLLWANSQISDFVKRFEHIQPCRGRTFVDKYIIMCRAELRNRKFAEFSILELESPLPSKIFLLLLNGFEVF